MGCKPITKSGNKTFILAFCSRVVVSNAILNIQLETDGNDVNYDGNAIDVSIDTADTDFGLPGRNKLLTRIKVRYKDVGQATAITVTVSTDGGNTFTTSGNSFTTASIGDGGTKEGISDIVLTAPIFRVRLAASGVGIDFSPQEIELQATLGGTTV